MKYHATNSSTWDKIETRQPYIDHVETSKKAAGLLKVGDAIFDSFFQIWRGVVSVDFYASVVVSFEDGFSVTYPLDYELHYVDQHHYFGWSSAESAQYFIDNQQEKM